MLTSSFLIHPEYIPFSLSKHNSDLNKLINFITSFSKKQYNYIIQPDIDDVKEGIIASKIAAHAADIAKGIPHARDIDDQMSKARGELNWPKMLELAIDKEKAIAYRKSSLLNEDDHYCSMCGDLCPMRRTRALQENKNGGKC